MIIRRLVYMFFCLMFTTSTNAQISYADSTVQAITYWNMGESVSYKVTYDKYQVNGIDTTKRVVVSYRADVTVIDSTFEGYTIVWQYYDYYTNDTNRLVRKLVAANDSIKVVYKIDEFGGFVGVVNVEEIIAFNDKAISTLKKELQQYEMPELEAILANLQNMYNSKNSIESNSIKDILQYHNFYGAKYHLGQVYEGISQVPNLRGDQPFDATIVATLEEIDEQYGTYRLFSSQTVDGDQLEAGVKDYFLNVLNIAPEQIDQSFYKGIKNQINTVGIYDDYGWLLSGYQKVEVSLGDDLNVEERYIYLD